MVLDQTPFSELKMSMSIYAYKNTPTHAQMCSHAPNWIDAYMHFAKGFYIKHVFFQKYLRL